MTAELFFPPQLKAPSEAETKQNSCGGGRAGGVLGVLVARLFPPHPMSRPQARPPPPPAAGAYLKLLSRVGFKGLKPESEKAGGMGSWRAGTHLTGPLPCDFHILVLSHVGSEHWSGSLEIGRRQESSPQPESRKLDASFFINEVVVE